MSTNNTNAQIDSMVAQQSLGAPSGPQGNATNDLRVDTDTGTVTVLGHSATTARIADEPGLDPMAGIAQIDASIADLTAKLDEQSFDPKTGASSPKLTGAERAKVELQLTSARGTREYQVHRAIQILAQREADTAAATAADAQAAAKFAFSGGDQRRAAAFDEALLRAEADEAARAVVRGRR